MSSIIDTILPDPVTTWLRKYDIVEPIMPFALRVLLPGGTMVLRTNSSACFDYIRERCRHMISEQDASQEEVVADIYCLMDTHLPAVVPYQEAAEVPYDASSGVFRSFRNEHLICAWHLPSLMGCVTLENPARLRIIAAAMNPRLYHVPTGGLRMKCGGPGISHSDVLDLSFCLFARVRDVGLLHGAVLEKNGSGVLIIGASGAGKTTASLALVRSGFRLLTDEYAVLWKTGVNRCQFSGLLVPAMLVGGAPESLDMLEETMRHVSAEKSAYSVQAAQTVRSPVRVKTVIALAPPAERISGHQAFPLESLELLTLLISQLLDPVSSDRMALMETLLEVAEDVNAFRVVAGTDLRSFPAFVEQLTAANDV